MVQQVNNMKKKDFLLFLEYYKKAKNEIINLGNILKEKKLENLEEDIDCMFEYFLESNFNDHQCEQIYDFIYNEYSDIDTEEELWDSIIESTI